MVECPSQASALRPALQPAGHGRPSCLGQGRSTAAPGKFAVCVCVSVCTRECVCPCVSVCVYVSVCEGRGLRPTAYRGRWAITSLRFHPRLVELGPRFPRTSWPSVRGHGNQHHSKATLVDRPCRSQEQPLPSTDRGPARRTRPGWFSWWEPCGGGGWQGGSGPQHSPLPFGEGSSRAPWTCPLPLLRALHGY